MALRYLMDKRNSGRLRIIAGHWRGRRIQFPASAKIRPTPDHVRETLFNWLAPSITDARCLDLYAGSGALGIEALSRGASAVQFIEANRRSAESIERTLLLLDASSRGNVSVRVQQAERFLAGQHAPWDIAFVDPPFGKSLAEPCVDQLVQSGLIPAGGLIYVETEKSLDFSPAVGTAVLREKSHGAATSRLLEVTVDDLHIDEEHPEP